MALRPSTDRHRGVRIAYTHVLLAIADAIPKDRVEDAGDGANCQQIPTTLAQTPIRLNVRVGCAPRKSGAFQWVQTDIAPPFSRPQFRDRGLKKLVQNLAHQALLMTPDAPGSCLRRDERSQ
jgi:hypothetical protein